jgi:hypothetical protein
MERCELIRTVAVLVFLAVALLRMGWEPLGDLIRSVLGRLHTKGGEAMYSWVVPPPLLTRLYEIREQTGVPIARQIREAVQAYLSQVEARPVVANPETFHSPEKGASS